MAQDQIPAASGMMKNGLHNFILGKAEASCLDVIYVYLGLRYRAID